MTTPLRVLIVEDKPADAELIVLRLTREGFKLDWKRVQTEDDFTAALASPWDLILADWSLPQFSGLRALQILRESGLEIPFIIISGSIGEDAAINAMHKGANDYLLKDRPERLGQAVHQALQQKLLQDAKKRTDQQLQLQSSALNAAANAIIITDRNGSIEWANPAFCVLSGYSLEEMIGKNPRELIKSEKQDQAFYKKMWDCILTGRVWHGELVNRRKDGQLYDEDLTITPLLDAAGGVIKFIAIKQDITERKNDEEQIKYQASLLANVNDAVIATDINHKITAWNHAAELLFGWKAEEAIGQITSDLLKTQYPITSRKEVLATRDSTGSWRGEISRARKDGVRISLEESTIALKDENGKITGYVGAGRDITERKKDEELIKYQASLLANVNDAIIATDANYKITAWNHAAELLFGWKEEEALGKKTADLLKTEYPDANRKELLEARDCMGRLYQEISRVRKDGVRISLDDSSIVLKDENGKISGYVGASHNITDRKKAEKVREAIYEISQSAVKTMEAGVFYKDIHRILGRLIPLENFYIFLYDQATDRISFTYFVDQFDPPESPRKPGRGLSEYVLRTGKPMLVPPEAFNDLMKQGKIELVGTRPVDWLGVPLKVGDKVFGVMATQTYSEDIRFSEDDLNLFETVSTTVALTIQRKQAEGEIRLRVNQLATARAIGKTLSETLELDQIYERLYQAVTKLLPDLETMFVSLFEKEKKEFHCVFAMSEGEHMDASKLPPTPLEPPGKGTQSEVVRTRMPLIVNDLQKRLKKVSLVVDVGKGSQQPQSGLYVPMLTKGEVIGVVIAQSQKKNRYTSDDAEMLSLVANTAAIAIQNAQLFAQTERRLQQISAMHTIDATISSSFDLELTFTILLEILTSQLGVDAADVLVLNKKTQVLECRGRRGFHTQALQFTRLPVGKGLAGRAALERKILVIKDLPGEMNGLASSPEVAAEGFVVYFGVPLTTKGEIVGVLEIFHREKLEPAREWFDYLENLAGQAAIAIDNSLLFNDLQRSNLDLSLAYNATILGWSNALDLRDKETEGHSQRVTQMTLQLAVRMELNEEELVHVRRGALLHDIGKMGVPDNILNKPGPLTDEEWVSMRKHPLFAYDLLAPISYLSKALDIPYCHHEKWDGTGYPRGLKGEQIPLPARIFAVVDVWDALTSDRPYRKAWTRQKALDHIRDQAGTHFDPQVVKEFLKLDEIKKQKG